MNFRHYLESSHLAQGRRSFAQCTWCSEQSPVNTVYSLFSAHSPVHRFTIWLMGGCVEKHIAPKSSVMLCDFDSGFFRQSLLLKTTTVPVFRCVSISSFHWVTYSLSQSVTP
jgi:hypothetical protein